MNRGKKPMSPKTKEKRGTFQKAKDGDKHEFVMPDDPPEMPKGITAGAKVVWQDNHAHVTASGVCLADSDLFRTYCEMVADERMRWEDPNLPNPNGAFIGERRRIAELLGIAGPKSRVIRRDPYSKGTGDDGKPANRFSRVGVRKRKQLDS